MSTKLLLLFSAAGLWAMSPPTMAAQQVVSSQKVMDTGSEQLWKVLFSGLVDVRFARTGAERNWMEQGPSSTNPIGGRGLTRYGGFDLDNDGLGDRKGNLLKLPQAYFVTDITYASDVAAHLQLNYDDADMGSTGVGNFGLAEGYVAWNLPLSTFYALRTRAGLLFPPVSMENGGVGWSTQQTLTPSAINTWIGEEVRPAAVELSMLRKSRDDSLTLSIAAISGSDTSGNLLAYRGWAMHDLQARKGTRLRIQQHVTGSAARTTDPMVEADGKLGYYGQFGFTLGDWLDLRYFRFDNLGDETTRSNLMDGAWRTKFNVTSLRLTPFNGFNATSQYLWGSTVMRPPPGTIDDAIYAWYGMLSYQWDSETLAARYDIFSIQDRDFPADYEGQAGHALTFAFTHQFSAAHRITAEWLKMESRREGNSGFGAGDPDDDLIQVNYRFVY